jgi:hypothetical protein
MLVLTLIIPGEVHSLHPNVKRERTFTGTALTILGGRIRTFREIPTGFGLDH